MLPTVLIGLVAVKTRTSPDESSWMLAIKVASTIVPAASEMPERSENATAGSMRDVIVATLRVNEKDSAAMPLVSVILCIPKEALGVGVAQTESVPVGEFEPVKVVEGVPKALRVAEGVQDRDFVLDSEGAADVDASRLEDQADERVDVAVCDSVGMLS